MKCATKYYSYKSKEINIEPLQILHLKKSLFLNPWVISKKQVDRKRKSHGIKKTEWSDNTPDYNQKIPWINTFDKGREYSTFSISWCCCKENLILIYKEQTFRHKKWTCRKWHGNCSASSRRIVISYMYIWTFLSPVVRTHVPFVQMKLPFLMLIDYVPNKATNYIC